MRKSMTERETVVVTKEVVVGEFEIDPFGDGVPAHEAAYLMIARADEPGVFRFDLHDYKYRITVEREDPNRDEVAPSF